MNLQLFARGLLVGFSIAAPVGPIGLLCIRRTLANGRWAGLASGLGAASADALYGSLAAFGLTAISSILLAGQFWFQLVGGLFLLWLGAHTMRARPAATAARTRGGGVAGAFATTFMLTLTNPVTILSFTAIFGGLGLATHAAAGAASGVSLVAGVFGGSAGWWFLLVGVCGLLRARFETAWMVWINRVSGAIIVVFGVLALLGLSDLH